MTARFDRAKKQSTNFTYSPAENTLQIKSTPAKFCCILAPKNIIIVYPIPNESPNPNQSCNVMEKVVPRFTQDWFWRNRHFWSNGYFICPTLVPQTHHHHTGFTQMWIHCTQAHSDMDSHTRLSSGADMSQGCSQGPKPKTSPLWAQNDNFPK